VRLNTHEFFGSFFQKRTLFLLLAIPTALQLAFLIPLGHAPDELVHALRADSLLHGAWIGHREKQGGRWVSGLPANVALKGVPTMPVQPMLTAPQPQTEAMIRQSEAVTWYPRTLFIPTGSSVVAYEPLPYVPGALAIAITRLLGGSPALAFLAIRLANIACFAVIGALALTVARRGQATIACVLLLPMTLSLAASCSQDGLLIATAALACACLSRLPCLATPARSPWFAAAAMLLTVLIASKPPYAPLALLLLLPLSRQDLWRRLAIAALVPLPALGWAVWGAAYVIQPPPLPPAEAGPLWPGARPAMFAGPDFAAQLRVLAAHPALAITLPVRSIWTQADLLLHQLVGILDWLCILLPPGLYYLWFAALAASVLSNIVASPPLPRCPASWIDCALPLAAASLAAIAVGTALYVQWTPVGMPWIGGIQGRYFLPLIPALALAPPLWPRPRASLVLQSLPLAVAAIDLVWLPRIVAAFYHAG